MSSKKSPQQQQPSSCSSKIFASSSIEPTITLQSSSSSTSRASAPARYSLSLNCHESEDTLDEQRLDKTAHTVVKPIEIPPSTTEEEELEDLGPEDPSGKSWSASLAAASLVNLLI